MWGATATGIRYMKINIKRSKLIYRLKYVDIYVLVLDCVGVDRLVCLSRQFVSAEAWAYLSYIITQSEDDRRLH